MSYSYKVHHVETIKIAPQILVTVYLKVIGVIYYAHFLPL